MMQPIKMTAVASLIAGLLLAFNAAHAGNIYKWVDDNGVTQMGDTVPDAYKSRAKVIGSTQSSIDPQQQKDAQARAAKDAERLKQLQASKTAPAAASPAPPASQATAKPVTSGSDCAALWAAYKASQACFEPFVAANGMKQSGASACSSVPDPTVQCGTTQPPNQ